MSGELGDLTEDVRRLFQELGHASAGRATAAGDCLPPLDVLETDESLQILMDLPGVPAASVRVLIKGSVVLDRRRKMGRLAGRRAPAAITSSSADPDALRVPCG